MQTTETLLHSEILDNHIGLIRLANAHNRNALSLPVIDALINALHSFQHPQVRAIVLTADSQPHRVWSAGADVTDLPPHGHDPLLHSARLPALMRAVQNHPAPILAMVDGSVWGAATELVLTCDLITASPNARFAITPANLGVPYSNSGLSIFLRRLPINIVREMFYAARPFSAEEALRVQLINHLVPAEELEDFTLNLARTIASKAPLVLAAVKAQTRILGEAAPLSPEQAEYLHELRHRALNSQDYLEGRRAFSERRAPRFHGE